MEQRRKFNRRDNHQNRRKEQEVFDKVKWIPKTGLGSEVKDNKITDIDTILDSGRKILEEGIVDCLLKDLSSELLLVGQSKGKFGGGQRRVFKQSQKKTQEGNKPRFATFCALGDHNGHIGLGYGKSKETVPAREKSIRRAKLNLIKIRRGCGSWQCGCKNPHSIPFAVHGKCGSSQITLIPAPRGTGLKLEKECAKMLKIAGIKDVMSKTKGQTKTKTNLITACYKALGKLINTKANSKHHEQLGIIEGLTPETTK